MKEEGRPQRSVLRESRIILKYARIRTVEIRMSWEAGRLQFTSLYQIALAGNSIWAIWNPQVSSPLPPCEVQFSFFFSSPSIFLGVCFFVILVRVWVFGNCFGPRVIP